MTKVILVATLAIGLMLGGCTLGKKPLPEQATGVANTVYEQCGKLQLALIVADITITNEKMIKAVDAARIVVREYCLDTAPENSYEALGRLLNAFEAIEVASR